MSKPVLVVLAAGMGSRYGGLKQMDPVGGHGQSIIDYSIYDARRAGFEKVIFVIKHEIEEDFKELVGNRISRGIQVEYAYQSLDDLPAGYRVPTGRTKPWGTTHAVLAARDLIDGPFAVINADDYYGKDAFQVMAASLERMAGEERSASMVAYYLRNTVSENGDVTRGVCEKDSSNLLTKVTETYGIKPCADGTIRSFAEDPAGVILPADALVSMNFWGFTPWLFAQGEEALAAFLRAPGDEMKKEYPLPLLVDTLMHEKGLRVEVLSTAAVWFGVTNPQDKAQVMAELRKLHDSGAYPPVLD